MPDEAPSGEASPPELLRRHLPTFTRWAPRLRSVRVRAFLVVVAIVVTPMLVVIASGQFERGMGEQMLREVRQGANEAVDLLATTELPVDTQTIETAVDRVAQRHKVRIRVLDEDGEVLIDANREAKRDLWRTLSNIWYGREGIPSLTSFDRTLGPLLSRTELAEARDRGKSAECRTAAGGEQIVCHAVLYIQGRSTEPDRIVYVQDSAPRAIGALRDVRRQITVLMLMVLPLAIALGWWLGWRFVQPIEKLREQLLAKAASAAPGADVDLGRGDEFGDLTQAFNSVLKVLQTRAKANEAFVADLAHEFKNPVAAIRACADALGDATDVDQKRATRIAGTLKDSSRRLDALLTQFLELARAEAGMPDEPRSKIDLDGIARGIMDSFSSDERWKALKFDVRVGGASVLGVGDRIESAMRNVIDNAVSFARTKVTVHTWVEGPFALIIVTDDGPGISPGDLQKVFNRFFTTRGADRGTGLGLALVRAVVEAHGGTVAARSAPGQGATFEIRLPVEPGREAMVSIHPRAKSRPV